MKSLILLTVGVVAGFALAHQYNKTPSGRRFFGGLDGSLTSFRAAVVDGYRAREAELRSDDAS
ncbi:hypothetical protein [Frigoribacterium faeni]|uniref:Uncharacterized protein n=1 Tax=Frigoribacterium faeni TaxID=145483 RepID=A0A7W3PHZ2_9MICO|nr:hypothetical protein [Frigoribacterium faeni]MBA8812835.1 hypothetical protein [Frigoribacterium faeni]BFF13964.1 hypothetical protein GCM10025699_52670 [Microbacterium flavescens]GEK82463.1 hypothetical protein FFA01_07720 [Frigoribacterium faeni]